MCLMVPLLTQCIDSFGFLDLDSQAVWPYTDFCKVVLMCSTYICFAVYFLYKLEWEADTKLSARFVQCAQGPMTHTANGKLYVRNADVCIICSGEYWHMRTII
jgi:hypothetical protein